MKKDNAYCVQIKGTLLYWQNRGGFDLGVQWLSWGDAKRVVTHYRKWADLDVEAYSYWDYEEMQRRQPKKAKAGKLSLEDMNNEMEDL